MRFAQQKRREREVRNISAWREIVPFTQVKLSYIEAKAAAHWNNNIKDDLLLVVYVHMLIISRQDYNMHSTNQAVRPAVRLLRKVAAREPMLGVSLVSEQL
jgi:hypothetical protein